MEILDLSASNSPPIRAGYFVFAAIFCQPDGIFRCEGVMPASPMMESIFKDIPRI